LLFERFGDVGLGEHDPKPQPVAGEAYGHRSAPHPCCLS
jgi:hypothetical protein